MNKEEAHIIDEILAGRTFRYEYFVERYSRQVFALIVRMVGNAEDAEELTQDVFMKAFEGLGRFGGKSSVATWLYRIAYNTAVSATRRRSCEVAFDDDRLAAVSDAAVDEALDDESELQLARLERAIDRLSADDKALVTLHYIEGRQIADVAYISGMSVANAKTRLHRVRKKLYLLITNDDSL